MFQLIRDIYRYRELIWVLALKELKVRYKRSALGFLWALLHPLLMTGIYVMVFSHIMRFGIERYPVFVLSAMFPWTFFQQALTYAVQSIVSNAPLLKKAYVPKMVFPLAAVLANLLNFLLSLIPLAFFLWVLGHPFYLTWLYLPVPLLALVLFTVGCSFLVATINVFFRDIGHMLEILLRAYFFFSPVIYDLNHIDPRLHLLFRWNPMVYILNGFRMAIFYGQLPSAASVFTSLGTGLVAMIVGYALFRRYQDSFALHV